jgi:hypothetical protein
LKRLFLKPDAFALLLQLAGLNIGLENTKAQKHGCWLVGSHGKSLN